MKLRAILISLLIAAQALGPVPLVAADETGFTHVAPTTIGGENGEYVHGAAHGKLLIRVLMLGAVGQQGIHYFPENTNLLDAILYSGGIDDTTKLNGITVRRKNIKNLIEINLEDLVEDGDTLPELIDGDVVTVPWNWRKDIGNITLVTGFVSSITAFTLAMIALAK